MRGVAAWPRSCSAAACLIVTSWAQCAAPNSPQSRPRLPPIVQLEWGGGLKQRAEAAARAAAMAAEAAKPFARSADDAELDALHRRRSRWGDPMVGAARRWARGCAAWTGQGPNTDAGRGQGQALSHLQLLRLCIRLRCCRGWARCSLEGRMVPVTVLLPAPLHTRAGFWPSTPTAAQFSPHSSSSPGSVLTSALASSPAGWAGEEGGARAGAALHAG